MDKSTIVDYFKNQAITGTWASLYDPTNNISYPFIQRFVKTVKLMQPIQGNILDMGCGTGIMVKVVTDAKASYTGFDEAQEMIDACMTKFQQEIRNGQAEFILAEAKGFKSNKLFQSAVGMGYIEYFDKPEQVFIQVSNYLAKGGKLILSFPHRNSIDYFMVQLFYPFRKALTALTGKKTIKPDRKMWSKNEAIELYQKYGYKNIITVNYNINFIHYPLTKIFPTLSNKISSMIEHSSLLSKISFFATGFIICAEKD
ncbi:MAG: methyltransferase domain-containing protein [Bacteroidia bacterium]|nr:methyltransferase domain-containing protein [Bacteroidia bacterium]MCZ2248312.1 class I SAM-dependent methyltransferase [Bacteroidia bacterium]